MKTQYLSLLFRIIHCVNTLSFKSKVFFNHGTGNKGNLLRVLNKIVLFVGIIGMLIWGDSFLYQGTVLSHPACKYTFSTSHLQSSGNMQVGEVKSIKYVSLR